MVRRSRRNQTSAVSKVSFTTDARRPRPQVAGVCSADRASAAPARAPAAAIGRVERAIQHGRDDHRDGMSTANAKSPAPSACIVHRQAERYGCRHREPQRAEHDKRAAVRQQLTRLKNIALMGGTSCRAARIGENQKSMATGM